MIQSLFMLGNKRSGTSFFVRLINLHPEIFISYESDIIWILYQKEKNLLPYKKYEWDSSFGMDATLKACKNIIENTSLKSSKEIFHNVILYLMRNKSRAQLSLYKNKIEKNLKWIGDKKPVQHSDPDIFKFIDDNFPTSKFIHLIRHPKDTISSMKKVPRPPEFKPKHWNFDNDELLKIWGLHQNWVLNIKEKKDVLTIRYEDLIVDPIIEMNKVFNYLDVTQSEEINNLLNKLYKEEFSERKNVNKKHLDFKIEYSDEVKGIMNLYGYE